MSALVWLTLPLVAIIGFQDPGRAVDPLAPVQELRDVRAEIKLRAAAHELVALELKGPTPPIVGYLSRPGRVRFDLVDDHGWRFRKSSMTTSSRSSTSTRINAWPSCDQGRSVRCQVVRSTYSSLPRLRRAYSCCSMWASRIRSRRCEHRQKPSWRPGRGIDCVQPSSPDLPRLHL
jgi:hypothetical protein